MLINAIRYNLANLTNFAGRDARATFWYYVLAVIVLQYIVQLIASIPMYFAIFTGIFEAAIDNPDDPGAPASAVEAMLEKMMGSIEALMIITAIIGVISVVLLGASFVRRLHDSGFSGWIALVPMACYLFSLGYNVTFVAEMENAMRDAMMAGAEGERINPFAMQSQMGAGLLGWIAPIIGIVFGVWPPSEGPNRYGPPPERLG